MRNLPSLFLFLGISGVCAVGCGGATTGGGNPPASVHGQVGGQPVPNADTVGVINSQNIPGPNGSLTTQTIAEVALLNIPNTCAILQRHGEPASTKIFAVGVVTTGSSVAAGTYNIAPTTSSLTTHAMAEYATTDAKCVSGPSEEAISGTVTITATATTSSSTIEGSFDVTLSTGDHLTGTFDAPVCHYDSSSTTTTPACGS